MSFGPLSVFTGSIASGASTSGEIDVARSWKTVQLEVGTMSTSAALAIYGASESGGTFRPVFHPAIQSATVATPQFYVASGVGTNGGISKVPNGIRYYKFVATGVVSGGVSLSVICSD